jgi:hypothetical protein
MIESWRLPSSLRQESYVEAISVPVGDDEKCKDIMAKD